MALTRSFKELVQKRVVSDPAFGEALLREGIDTMVAGDVDTGKAILRDYIKATVGFEKLGEATGTSAGPQHLRHHRLPAETGRRRAPRQAGAGLNGRPHQRNSGCLMINAVNLNWVGHKWNTLEKSKNVYGRALIPSAQIRILRAMNISCR